MTQVDSENVNDSSMGVSLILIRFFALIVRKIGKIHHGGFFTKLLFPRNFEANTKNRFFRQIKRATKKINGNENVEHEICDFLEV